MTIDPEDLRDARIFDAELEAARFLRRVKEWQRARLADAGTIHPGSIPIQSGALRRASLDLTRALATMRKSPYGT